MYAELTTALASIKTMSDLSSLIIKSKVSDAVRQNAIELQSAIISLQSTILSIQAQNQELQAENNRLKQQLADLKGWEEGAQNYSLTEIASGVLVYALKPEKAGANPPHWLCVHCYENKQKSILQRGKKTHSGTIYSCPKCKTEILDHSDRMKIAIG